MLSISIVLPCHNEAEAIAPVLSSLERVMARLKERHLISSSQIIVVDDASSDGSLRLLRSRNGLDLVSLKERSGYGAALKAGFRQTTGDWVVFLDMDGTYDPDDLELFVRAAATGYRGYVLGERFSLGEGMPLLRVLGNSCFSWLVSVLYRQAVTDACTGYRMFPRSCLSEVLSISPQGLNFSLAMTLLAIQSEKRILEIPIRYHSRHGVSKLSIITDGFRFLGTILRQYFARIWVR